MRLRRPWELPVASCLDMHLLLFFLSWALSTIRITASLIPSLRTSGLNLHHFKLVLRSL